MPLYGMKRLIAVSADNFFFTGIYNQIHCLKRDSAEQDFIGMGQYEGFANGTTVLPYYLKRTRHIILPFCSIGERS
jgi:hypothetical protein